MFEWDPAKNASNRGKHCISFDEAKAKDRQNVMWRRQQESNGGDIPATETAGDARTS